MKVIKILLWIMSGLYLCLVCVLWSSSHWPRSMWWLANLIQMAPLWVALLPAGLIFTIAALVRQRYLILASLFLSVFVLFGIMGFNMPISSVFHRYSDSNRSFRIMTCNLGLEANKELLSKAIREAMPDIILFQEVYDNNQRVIEAILSRDTWEMSFGEYVGIASRVKLADVDIKDRSIVGGAEGLVTKYTLETDKGKIFVFNVHFETSRSGIQAMIDNNLYGLPEMVKVTRQQEVDSALVSQWIKKHEPVLIAGDFNMRNVNPMYRQYWSPYTDTFSKSGFGFGYTSNTRWHGVRIDHILYDENWAVIKSWIGPDIGSDHKPVIADLKLRKDDISGFNAPTIVESPLSDPNSLIFENFEMSLGRFKDNKSARMYIDTQNNYISGNVLKVERNSEAEYRLGVNADIWRLKDYPFVSFSYKILRETPLEMRVKTIYDDWMCLGRTESCERINPDLRDEYVLIDDGEWHEINIDVQSSVKSVLSKLDALTEFQFYIEGERSESDTFWIDNFRIYSTNVGLEAINTKDEHKYTS